MEKKEIQIKIEMSLMDLFDSILDCIGVVSYTEDIKAIESKISYYKDLVKKGQMKVVK